MRDPQSPRRRLAAALIWAATSVLPAPGVSGAGPALELAPPVVDQTTLRVAVLLKNRGGTALAPSDLIVRYTVTGVARGARPTLAEGMFEATGIAIAPGRSIEIGHFVLPDPDRALSFEDVTVSLRAEPRRPGSFEIVEASFPHHWNETTLAVTSAQLDTLGATFSVTLDNHDAGTGGGRSAVTLTLGRRVIEAPLDLPRPCAIASGGSEAPPPGEALLVANLSSSTPPRSQAISIRNGKLQVRMELGSSCNDEIRIAPVHSGRLGTSARAAADVRPFTVEVELTPAVSADRGHLSYGHLPVVRVGRIVTVAAGGPPHADAALEEAVETCIRGPLTQQIRTVFDRSDVRIAMEELLTATAAGHRIKFIHGVTGRGDTLLVTYV